MKIRNFTVTTRYSDTPRMKIPVYTTSRQDVPARRLRRHRYLTIIAVQCNAETASLKERMTDLTVKQVEICLLKAEIGHLKHLHLHLEHLHLQRGLPAPSPTLQVSTSPTTWPDLQLHLFTSPGVSTPKDYSYQYLNFTLQYLETSAEITIQTTFGIL